MNDRCTHLVVHGRDGLIPPRQCRRFAADGTTLCRLHAVVVARRPPVEVRVGGFCVCCGAAGHSYVVNGITIALCGAHGRALARAIREGR